MSLRIASVVAVLLALSPYGLAPCTQHATQQAGPGARLGHSLVFDARLGEVVLLDGPWPQTEQPSGSLWRWNGSVWVPLSDAGPPVTAMGAAVVDSRRGQLITYGGRVATGAVSALWEWSAGGRRQARDTTPGGRFHHAMAYDSARGVTVMYGGAVAGRWDTSTWEWDGSAWKRLDVPGPGPRAALRMTYDSRRRVVVLFGGAAPPSGDDRPQEYLGDTWTWNGTEGRRAATTGPAGRRDYSMTYDARRGLVLLYGGAAGTGAATRRFDDMWSWDGTSWRELTLRAPTPGHRYVSAMAYDARRDRTVLYGGYSCQPGTNQCGVRDDTWEWDGSAWARMNP